MKSTFHFITLLLFPVLLTALLTASCKGEEGDAPFCLKGVWMLQKRTCFDGSVTTFPHNGSSRLRIYDDSCYYDCTFASAPTGMMVTPNAYQTYNMIQKGPHDWHYLQGDYTYPLTVVDDTTIIVQEIGSQYLYTRAARFEADRIAQIIALVRETAKSGDGIPLVCEAAKSGDDGRTRYVFSEAEQRLTTANRRLGYAGIGITVVLLLLAVHLRNLKKEKRRIEQELRQIEQERLNMPQPVRQALDSVEADFLQSDFYMDLRRRITGGKHLTDDEWAEVDSRMQGVDPGFGNKLLSLHSMSDVEYRVCLLLKLKATPSEIAGVMCKDASTISSIRSRLYHKVFGKKGSSKDWDDFIRTL